MIGGRLLSAYAQIITITNQKVGVDDSCKKKALLLDTMRSLGMVS